LIGRTEYLAGYGAEHAGVPFSSAAGGAAEPNARPAMSPTHSNCGAFRAWQGATANAPMSGPAGCGEIGGGRTLVNRQWHADRRPLARNHALVNVWQPTIGCQSGPIERVSAAPPPRDACGANHQGYAYG